MIIVCNQGNYVEYIVDGQLASYNKDLDKPDVMDWLDDIDLHDLVLDELCAKAYCAWQETGNPAYYELFTDLC